MNVHEAQHHQRPPGYELFFAPLQVALNPTDYERVKFAYLCSKHGHEGKFRDNGVRFFDHPKAAAWIYIDELGGRDPRVIIDTLLHDISEEAYLLSPYRIAHNFGEEVALDVGSMTKLPKGKETTPQFLGRIIKQGAYAILAKLIDRLHNTRDLAGCTPEKRVAQLAETETYHLPMLIPALAAFSEPWSGYAKQVEHLIIQAMDDARHPLPAV